jgi:cell division protein DivIC
MNELYNTLLSKLPAPLRNRYFVTAVAFIAFMVFFDRHDVLTQIRLQRTVNKLEQDKVFYEGQIKTAEEERLDMQVNKERFAREQYFMQRNNEDVFIITKEED